jgi:hypothetical protein
VVRCSSAASCWAGGTYGQDAANELNGVACSADANRWAVGDDDVTVALNEILHWTGHKWAIARVPQPAGTATGSSHYLASVFCVSATDCWAVGYTQGSGLPEVNQILHWTGKKWTDFG